MQGKVRQVISNLTKLSFSLVYIDEETLVKSKYQYMYTDCTVYFSRIQLHFYL